MRNKVAISTLSKSFHFVSWGALTIVGIYLRYFSISRIVNEPKSDFLSYYNRAVNFAANLDYYTITKPMGYPILLGGWFKLTQDTSIFNAKLFNFILSILTLIGIYFLCRQLKLNSRQSLIIFATFSICPMVFLYVNVLGVETITIFFITIFLNAFFAKSLKWQIRYLLIGLISGILATFKSYFLTFPIVVIVLELVNLYFGKEQLTKKYLVGFVCMISAMGITLLPSIIKNYSIIHEFVPVSTNANHVLYLNNNDLSLGGNITIKTIFKDENQITKIGLIESKFPSREEIDFHRDNLYGEFAIEWIGSHPKEFTKLGFLRLSRVFLSSGAEWAISDMAKGSSSNISVHRLFILLQNYYSFFKYLLVVALFLFILNHIHLLTFARKYIHPLSLLIILVTLWQTAVYFVGEGQGRYFQTFIPFAILALPYFLDGKSYLSENTNE